MLGIVLFLVAVLFKRRKEAPRLPYQRPVAAKEKVSRFDEYAQVLEGRRAGRLQEKTRKGTFALIKAWQAPEKAPPPPPKSNKAPPPPRKPFYSYQPEKTAKPDEEAPTFLAARIYQDQQVEDGAGIVAQLVAGAPGLPPGTRLFGPARFAKNRLLIAFTTAEHNGRRWHVHCTGYDEDFLPGIACPGLAPSTLEKPADRLASRAIAETGTAGILHDVGRSTVEVWKNLRKKKTATLEDGKVIYLKPQKKKPKRK